MEAKSELERIYRPIQKDLQTVEQRLYDLIPSDLEPISTVERYIHDNGGKRLRSALVLLSARAVGLPDLSPWDAPLPDHTITFAAASELLHAATLVHDDLLDGSVLRRGHETINSRWGHGAALLSGDHLYLKAMELLTSENILDPDRSDDFRQTYQASRLMLQTAARMFKGEALQHRKRGELSTTEEDYFHIIGNKSASFISSCCAIGAMLNDGVHPEVGKRMADYGFNLGMAFQIRDDILDLMGDEERIGKAVGSDLREGRLTLPAIHLVANANGNRKYLESILSSPSSGRLSVFYRWWRHSNGNHRAFSKRQLQRVRKLLLDHGSIEYSTDTASNFADMAKSNLDAIPDSAAKQSLMTLADHVITREN
ncbi:polyprenyl synthetase family protein [Candidatus Poribacteria bacterium]